MVNSVFDKTPEELSQELNKKSTSETQKQTLAILGMLEKIGHAILENKSVQVENIVREVVGKVAVERPDWIKELLPNTTPLEKKLDYIASAIIRKEVVRKMDFNRPSWLDEIKPKDIVFPESKEAEKINPILDEILKAIQEQEVIDEVSIKGEVEIKEPKWYRPIDLEKPMLSMAKFFKGLQEKLFKVEVQNEITIKNPVEEITVKNPVKEVSISNLKKLEDNTALMTAQLRALGTTGGGSGQTGLATEETLANITTPSDNQNVELINALRVLTLAIANPSYVDKSANVIRNQIQSGTVTTVGTVTNMGVWPGGQLSFTASQNTWANMCRSLIT